MGDDKSSDLVPLVQLRAKFQLPAGDLMELPGAQLWDGLVLVPAVYGNPANPESPGGSGLGLEEGYDVFFEHRPMLSIANPERKNDLPADGYASSVETMGDRIRLLRQAKTLTQEQLGERIGVSKVAVSQWETGSTSNIRLKTFLALCDELGTSPHYLIFGPDPPRATRRRSA